MERLQIKFDSRPCYGYWHRRRSSRALSQFWGDWRERRGQDIFPENIRTKNGQNARILHDICPKKIFSHFGEKGGDKCFSPYPPPRLLRLLLLVSLAIVLFSVLFFAQTSMLFRVPNHVYIAILNDLFRKLL